MSDTSYTITVGTSDLRAALQAVAPHAGNPKDGPTHRVRLLVSRTMIITTATNRVTAAMAQVDVENGTDLSTDDEIAVDITPINAREIVTLFQSGADGDDDQPGDLLELRLGGGDLTITDTGGLFDGKSLTLPDYGAPEHFPDLPAIIKSALERKSERTTSISYNAKMLSLFAAASKAYDNAPITIEPTSQTTVTVVAVGEAFLGVIMPIKFDEDALITHKEHREAWHRRLERITASPFTKIADTLRDAGVSNVTLVEPGGKRTSVDL